MITSEIIIVAPEGTFSPYEINSPTNDPTKPINTDANIMFLNFLVKRFVMVGGTVSKEIRRIIPTNLMLKTMVIAKKALRI